jgi:hypothetical protein
MQYPGGAKFDAQAMVLDKGDVPIIFAHEPNGVTGIYKPSKALEAEITENLPQLAKIGTFTPANTNTANPKGAIGNALVTGAAKSPDGKHVVVRTLSDAYEFKVGDDGDVAKALTTTPVVTPLPNEADGQAITYSADGTKFITVSKAAGATLMTWTRYDPPPVTAQATEPTEETPVEEGGLLSKIKNLGFGEMTRIIAAVGVVGLVLAIAGIIGIRRARRRRREEEEYDDYDDYDDEPRSRRGRGRGRDDDAGYGVREPSYSAGYDDQGGYGDQYGAGASYGGYSNGYGAQQGGYDQGYGGQPGYDQYGAQPGYDQYGGQQPGYDQYGGQPGYDQYGGQGGQGQYGGYGYEGEFDPLQDPRRH